LRIQRKEKIVKTDMEKSKKYVWDTKKKKRIKKDKHMESKGKIWKNKV
jgi:hypothetical protein